MDLVGLHLEKRKFLYTIENLLSYPYTTENVWLPTMTL
jgi:hypothetical protein